LQEGPPPSLAIQASSYGNPTSGPVSVGYSISIFQSPVTESVVLAEAADVSEADTPSPRRRLQLVQVRARVQSSNEPTIEGSAASAPAALVDAPVRDLAGRETSGEAPPTATLLIAPTHSQAPLPRAAAFTPSKAVAAELEPHTSQPVEAKSQSSEFVPAILRKVTSPVVRFRILYASLIPAVIIINMSFEAVRGVTRDLVTVTSGFPALQKQVADLKTQAAAVPPQPVAVPIQVSTSQGPFPASFPTPLPDRGQSPSPQPDNRTINAVAAEPHDRSPKVNPAKEEIPDAGEFVLAADSKGSAVKAPIADVPPPNEFKLLGEK
jgi:hypothetical protein